MNQRFVVSNQHGHYYSKSKTWIDGRDPGRVYCPAYRDEALNTLLEINSRDIDLRGMIVEVETNSRGLPVLTISDVPLPEPDEPETAEQTESEGDDIEEALAADATVSLPPAD